jgi:hypothetical protein
MNEVGLKLLHRLVDSKYGLKSIRGLVIGGLVVEDHVVTETLLVERECCLLLPPSID